MSFYVNIVFRILSERHIEYIDCCSFSNSLVQWLGYTWGQHRIKFRQSPQQIKSLIYTAYLE